KEAGQIESMISQVLMLSKLDNQLPIQNLQAVSIVGLMTPIITDAEFEAKQKGKTISYLCDCSLTIDAEPQLLSSAVENVLRNAIHYANGIVKVKVSLSNNMLEWTILDDGNGIPETQLTKIFDAFYRESTARDRDSGGIGLGLAIACQAIAKHNGTIKAVNRSQGGLAVIMTIPIV
ncbi:MAG: ATP-binding protein, partial [Paraglaciecola sp.]